jgi:putative serine protease PepD
MEPTDPTSEGGQAEPSPGEGPSWAPPSWESTPAPVPSEPAPLPWGTPPAESSSGGAVAGAGAAGAGAVGAGAATAPLGSASAAPPYGPPVTPPAATPPPPRPAGRWKTGVVAAAVAASGLVGGAIGSQLGDGSAARVGLAPAPVTGGSAVALPVDGFADLYKRMLPTVVQIQAGQGAPTSSGSGVIVDASGLVATAAHLVGNSDSVKVILSDGSAYDATVLGRDEQGDLAVLRIKDAPKDLAAAPLGDSNQLAVGQTTAAIGAPFSLPNTLTVGVISALNRTFQADPVGAPLRGLIQTDASINPGSSGGPLFDAAGRVIGINTAIKSPVGASVGIGFAVPVNQLRDSIPLLSEGKAVSRPFLGIEGSASGQGVAVARVTPGSSAEGAGIQSGDIIVGIEGQKVRTVEDIGAELTRHKVGDRIEVTVKRGGGEQKLSVELKALPQPSS